jgi:glycosyltransferase involved in cell wall biosynthesis
MKKNKEKITLIEKASHSLIITVSKTVRNVSAFSIIIESLKIRFNIKVSLIFQEPDLLFFNSRLLAFISKGSVERILVSDRPSLFFFDVIEFAKRHETDFISVIDGADIVENWLDFTKHLISNQFNELEIIKSVKDTSITLKKNSLRELPSYSDQSFSQMVERLSRPVTNIQKLNGNMEYSNRASLFVTKEGIERFGGLDKFLKSKFVIDGLDYQKKLSSQDITKSRFVEIPGILSSKIDLILDVNPAATNIDFSLDSKILNVPRCVLSVTLSSIKLNSGLSAKKAVFAMSNYNKQGYLAGSIYSIAMQSYKNISLDIIDDISTDSSQYIFSRIFDEFDKEMFPIRFEQNKINKGTYWIRNQIVNRYCQHDTVYLVNDSDDFSSSQRACFQLSILDNNPDYQIAFGDIIRVDCTYKLLPLDGKVERYGTASLASKAATHNKYGYYENIMKNADTEYIERIKKFAGKTAVHWFRYPVLFQPFDGNNLTSDIYSTDSIGAKLQQQLSKRSRHVELFSIRHRTYEIKELPKIYSFNSLSFPDSYVKELKEFLVAN